MNNTTLSSNHLLIHKSSAARPDSTEEMTREQEDSHTSTAVWIVLQQHNRTEDTWKETRLELGKTDDTNRNPPTIDRNHRPKQSMLIMTTDRARNWDGNSAWEDAELMTSEQEVDMEITDDLRTESDVKTCTKNKRLNTQKKRRNWESLQPKTENREQKN